MKPSPDLSRAFWSRANYVPATPGGAPALLVPHLRPRMTALDVGCHTGATARFLATLGLEVTGIDVNASAISRASEAIFAGTGNAPRYLVGDALLHLPSWRSQFDVLVLNRILTCLAVEAEWETLLDGAHSALVPGGFLYVNDFEYLPTDSYQRRRYEAALREGYEPRRFPVYDDAGNVLFVARHHDEVDLARIRAPYETLAFRRYATTSGTGHSTAMFELVAQKQLRASVEAFP